MCMFGNLSGRKSSIGSVVSIFLSNWIYEKSAEFMCSLGRTAASNLIFFYPIVIREYVRSILSSTDYQYILL